MVNEFPNNNNNSNNNSLNSNTKLPGVSNIFKLLCNSPNQQYFCTSAGLNECDNSLTGSGLLRSLEDRKSRSLDCDTLSFRQDTSSTSGIDRYAYKSQFDGTGAYIFADSSTRVHTATSNIFADSSTRVHTATSNIFADSSTRVETATSNISENKESCDSPSYTSSSSTTSSSDSNTGETASKRSKRMKSVFTKQEVNTILEELDNAFRNQSNVFIVSRLHYKDFTPIVNNIIKKLAILKPNSHKRTFTDIKKKLVDLKKTYFLTKMNSSQIRDHAIWMTNTFEKSKKTRPRLVVPLLLSSSNSHSFRNSNSKLCNNIHKLPKKPPVSKNQKLLASSSSSSPKTVTNYVNYLNKKKWKLLQNTELISLLNKLERFWINSEFSIRRNSNKVYWNYITNTVSKRFKK